MVINQVDADLFSDIEHVLKSHFRFGDFPEWVPFLVLPKVILEQKSSYNFTDGPQEPMEYLTSMRGDCEDQTVVLASIYQALGLDTVILSLRKPDYKIGHILPLAGPSEDVPPQKMADLIRVYYYDRLGEQIGGIATDSTTSRGELVVVGSTITRYVGDIQSLVSEEYAYRGTDGWQWRGKDYERPV